LGDVAGTVSVDANYIFVCTAPYDSTTVPKVGITNTYASGNIITMPNTTSLVVNAPIIFTGTTDTANTGISANEIYYIKTISSPNITISTTGFDGTAGNALALGTSTVANMDAISYNGSTIWKRIDLASVTGNDTVTGNLTVNYAANIGTNLVVTGNVTAANSITSAYAIGSVGTSISAAGTTQGTATAIAKDNNIISTVASGANGVVLPTAVAGMRIYIKNTSANALNVFPAANASINSLSANASISQVANASAFYISTSTTQWYSY
jgi:hypothetical protein